MSPRRARAVAAADAGGSRTLREHLIASTRELIAQGGVVNLTARHIASHAGVAAGVLYNHFTDKDDLVLSAMVEQFRQLADAFLARRPTAGEATVEENLLALCRAGVEFFAALHPLVRGLVAQPELQRRFLDAIHAEQTGPQHLQASISTYVTEEQHLGRATRDADAAAAAALLFGACHVDALATVFSVPRADGVAERPGGDMAATAHLLARALAPERSA